LLMPGLPGCIPLLWPSGVEAQAEIPEWVRATIGEACSGDGAAVIAKVTSFGAPPARAFATAGAGRYVCALWRGSRRAQGARNGAALREQRARCQTGRSRQCQPPGTVPVVRGGLVWSVRQHGWLMRMFPAAAGAVASAMAAESRGKPKIKGAAWRRPRGTGSAAGGE